MQRGAVNVHCVSAAGKEQIIHVFRAGESFAEAALAANKGYPADAHDAKEPEGIQPRMNTNKHESNSAGRARPTMNDWFPFVSIGGFATTFQTPREIIDAQ